ncbi:MAG: DMT family transporter, partial [Chloroflexi bacterium]|nr:DMT family transporter [Chloroflexota bacterium]
TWGRAPPLCGASPATVPPMGGMVSAEPVDGLVLVGMLFALAAVVAVAMPDRHAIPDVVPRSRATRLGGWLLIVTAGLGFAGFFLCVDQASELGGPAWWTLAAARSISMVLIVLILAGLLLAARGPSTQGARAVMPLLVASAVGDTGGNLFFILSRAETILAVSVVLSSLFPVSTVVLARVVLHERLSRLALVGVMLAVCGVVLIGVGSIAG